MKDTILSMFAGCFLTLAVMTLQPACQHHDPVVPTPADPNLKFRIANVPLQDIAGATPKDPIIQFDPTKVKNSCYIQASGFQEAYQTQMEMAKRKHDSGLIYVDVVERIGHAICAFKRNDNWYIYDSLNGTTLIGHFDKRPSAVDLVSRYKKSYENAAWMQ